MRFFGVLLAMALLSISVSLRAETLGQSSAHDFVFTANDGQSLPLSAFKGKAVLVVNTASECSFTKQYAPLQNLYEEYRDRGLVIVGVPSNDFGGQEPGTDAEIAAFAEQEFQVEFPLTTKTAVRGEAAAPFYRWAASEVGALGVPRWNFHKYLIGPDGQIVDWFSTMTSPKSSRLKRAIESALPTSG